MNDTGALELNKEKRGSLQLAVLESFNEQFAENQRAREALFARIVGYIGFIVVGYGFTQQIDDVSITTLSYAAVAASILLALGAFFVASMAYSWRRDQGVNNSIREIAGLMGEEGVFPSSFRLRKKKPWTWMPDLMMLFYVVFPVFQVMLIVHYINYCWLTATISSSDTTPTVTVVVLAAFLIVSVRALFYYYGRYSELINKPEKESEKPQKGSEKQ